MIDREARSRAEAIEHFAAVLRALREVAGSPSFRKMSGRSHAISHTTLHEAAQGHRFPSWATTAEFVRACGADPADYRERWEQASQDVRSATTPSLAPDSSPYPDPYPSPDPHPRHGEADHVDEAVPAASARLPRRRFWHTVSGVVAVGAVVAVAVIIGSAVSRGDDPHAGSRVSFSSPSASLAPSSQSLTAADCPVHQSNPPAAEPAHPGDMSAFIDDILLPDCTHVRRGSTVAKVWRLKNIGTVPWRGYVLHRVDLPQRRDQCQTIPDVPVKDTEPGEIVDIKVMVMAPNNPGFCFVRFKMEDSSGRIAFPGSRPVNFQLIID